MKVLFIGSKYYDQTVESGLNNTEHYIIGSAKQAGVELDAFHFDEYLLTNGKPGDDAVVDMAERGDFDFILLDIYLASSVNPTCQTLKDLNIPIVCIWWDTVWPQHCEMADKIQDFVSLNVSVDSGMCFVQSQKPEKYIYLWTPQDPSLYHPRKKDIEIAFYGRVGKLGREEVVDRLRKLDGFITLGGKNENFVSKENYTDQFGRTKIIVNFSKSYSGHTQMVGHTMEAALSGCLLLEQKGRETPGFFVKGQDYIEWSDINDLMEKAKYYIKHQSEAKEIADRLLKKANKYYNCKVWWETVHRNIKR